MSHIDKYIQEELSHNAVLGPLDSKPFDVHISPLMTRNKSNSDCRRTIFDLSFPKGYSVNDGVLKDNSNSNSTFIALNLRQKTDSKAHHTKTLFNIQKPETLQGSAPRRKQKGDWKFRVGMLFQRGMTSTLT